MFSAGNEALAGEPLVLSVETESFEEVVRFPRGATCVTPYDGEAEAPGTCAIIFRLMAPVVDIVLRLRAQRALNVNDAVAPRPLADRASASIRVVAPGAGSRVWQSGDSDPLSGADPMPISMEDDEPTPLWVVLDDRFGNPLVGERVELRPPGNRQTIAVKRTRRTMTLVPTVASMVGKEGCFVSGWIER